MRVISFLLCISIGLIACSENLSPEKKALKLVRDSYSIDSSIPVYQYIENLIKEKQDDIKVVGWDVKKISEQEYLVSYKYKIYSFNEGVQEMEFLFEVDLNNDVVKNVTDRYLKDMPPPSKAYGNEKEIFNNIINDDDLSGNGQ